jgi:hypothetical protein
VALGRGAVRRSGGKEQRRSMSRCEIGEKAFPLHRVCGRIRARMGQHTWARKTTAWSEPTGSSGLDRGGRVMAPTARSDSAQGTRGVALPSGPHGPDWWRPWASSSQGGLGPDLVSWAALSSGPGPVKTFQCSNSFLKTWLL